MFIRHELRVPEDNLPDTKAPGAPGKRGGGGGQTFRIELPAYQQAEAPAPVTPEPVEKPPVPQVVVKPPPIKVQKLELPTQGTVTNRVDISALPGTGEGPGKGGGAGTGVGPGAGVDSDAGTGGEGGDAFPPKPKQTILPPFEKRPPSTRGISYRIHFKVAASGRVTAVRVDPEIADAAYRKNFLAAMRDYEFVPAHKLDGTPIEGEFTITIEL